MGTEIVDPEEKWKLSPEMDEVISSYLRTSSITETAKELEIPKEKVNYYLSKPEAKRLVDTVMIEQTYLHRHKLQQILSDVLEAKLEEMEESQLSTSKDILDVIQLAHKINTDNEKLHIESVKPVAPTHQINQQFNNDYGNNYHNLLKRLEDVNK